jgi:hypothetical protein
VELTPFAWAVQPAAFEKTESKAAETKRILYAALGLFLPTEVSCH